MIRLAVRCAPEQAEVVLAELAVLAPNGVEEEHGSGYVEYALYGGEGELPELGEIEAAAGDGLVEVIATEVPDDWADRWQDFHRPILIGDRLCVRPSWAEPEARDERVGPGETQSMGAAIDVVVDPGRAFGTGAHPTTRLCLELLLELAVAGEADGELADLGTGSGVLAIAAAKLGWRPVRGYDHEEEALRAAATNAGANGVEVDFGHADLRREVPALAATTVANLTAPTLHAVAAQAEEEHSPRTMICSGLLPAELDGVAASLSGLGLVESERRHDGDWAALLLRRP